MNREELAMPAIFLLVFFALLCIYGAGILVGKSSGYRNGYIQCLNDMKNGVPPQYQLVVKKNGESKWEEKKD